MASFLNLGDQDPPHPAKTNHKVAEMTIYYPLQAAENQELTRNVQLSVKRAFDIAFAATMLLVLAPLFLVLILAVKLDSPGPAFFSQVRWGKDGKKIRIYKFRSMRIDACDPTGVAQTVHGDPRITRLGAFLRKTNIDELPQFYNVLKGDMSLIGPRCHAIGMRAAGKLYEELVPQYHHRHSVRPGLTGLAQVRGWRGPTDKADSARARIAADLHYIDNYSLALDVKIFIATIVTEIRGGHGF